MREILFRGKRVDNRGWSYGTYVKATHHWHKNGVHKDWIVETAFANGGWFNVSGRHAVDPETVGQYTGLKDKNGKKIFEGDIISIAQKSDSLGTYFHPPVRYPVNAIVKWDLCSWLWECTQDGQTWYIHFPNAWCHFECEVIGNIYDNPELIGG